MRMNARDKQLFYEFNELRLRKRFNLDCLPKWAVRDGKLTEEFVEMELKEQRKETMREIRAIERRTRKDR